MKSEPPVPLSGSRMEHNNSDAPDLALACGRDSRLEQCSRWPRFQ